MVRHGVAQMWEQCSWGKGLNKDCEEKMTEGSDPPEKPDLPYWTQRLIGVLTVLTLFLLWPFDDDRPGIAGTILYAILGALVVEAQVQIGTGRVSRVMAKFRKRTNGNSGGLY